MIGRTLSHYRIVAQLGAGGMGVVYRAEDVRLGREVAVKFVSQDFAHDEQARAAPALGGARRLGAEPPEHLHDLRRRRSTTATRSS